MNKSFTQTDKTMNDKAEISRVPSRARAHALFEHACAYHTLKTLLLNAAVVIAILLGTGAGNRAWGQSEVTFTKSAATPSTDATTTTPSDASKYKTYKWTVPQGVKKVKVYAIGAGGAGGNTSAKKGTAVGGGGGGGAYGASSQSVSGGRLDITVGLGKTAAAGNPSMVTYTNSDNNTTTVVQVKGGKKGSDATVNGKDMVAEAGDTCIGLQYRSGQW